MADLPDFRNRGFLLDHIRRCLAFYHPRGLDPAGGFFHVFSNDGTVIDRRTRSLVSSCRFLFIHTTAYRLFGEAEHRDAARHALDFLVLHHRDPMTLGYRWQFAFSAQGRTAEDARNLTYGLSFVVLAFAMAVQAGFSEANWWLEEVFAVMERRLYEPAAGLYADEATADWSRVGSYRGQNANMHACEAMLAAFEATGNTGYLDRADDIAQSVTVRLAAASPLGQVWEHYQADWSLAPEHNRNDHSDGYRPWGYLSGHQTEWAKLLMMIDRFRPAAWHVDRARALFDQAMDMAWDGRRGGILYSYDHHGTIYDSSKQQWTHAETLAAAAHLAVRTGDARYWDWYDRIWGFVWTHLVDHTHGGWFRALDTDNRLATAERGIPEPDYHNIGACAEILRCVDARPA